MPGFACERGLRVRGGRTGATVMGSLVAQEFEARDSEGPERHSVGIDFAKI